MRCKHLGYFNEPEDIKYLKDKSADEVIKYFLDKMGAFFHSQEYMEVDVPIEKTTDGKYAVIKDITDTNLEEDNNFIDIFEV